MPTPSSKVAPWTTTSGFLAFIALAMPSRFGLSIVYVSR